MGSGHGAKVKDGRTDADIALVRRLALAVVLCALAAAGPASAGTRVWAVGDGGVPDAGDDRLAAQVGSWGIDRLLYLGDVYETGSAREYRENYAPGWGRFKAITRPTPGNHEWESRAEGYDRYWGRRARGARGAHYYSFDIGGWHLVSLNSHEDSSPSSPQVAWLRRDLSRFAGSCTIAFWHRPRYSAGSHSDAEDVDPFWGLLAGRAAVVLNGHNHNYQRFKRVQGITQFTAGAGGRRPLHDADGSSPRLAAFDDSSLGALRMDLQRSALNYEYRRLNGERSDSGRVRCRAHRPVVAVDRPAGRVLRRGTPTLRGRARGYVGALRVSLVRRAPDGTCTAFDGTRFRRSSCGSPRSFSLRDSGRWNVRLPPSGVRAGEYVLEVRAFDPAGRRGSEKVNFRVR